MALELAPATESSTHPVAEHRAPDDGAAGPATQRPLRLALLVDGLGQPAWVAQVLAAAVVEHSVSVVGVGVLRGLAAADDRGARAEDAYLRLDAGRYARVGDPSQPVDLADVCDAVAAVDVGAAVDASSGRVRLDAAGAEVLRAMDAEVVWYLGGRPLEEPVPVLAGWGVWALDPAGGARGVRAVLRGEPATATALRRVTDAQGPGGVLVRVRSRTQRISVTVNQAEHARHLATCITGVFRRTSRSGPPNAVPEPPVGTRAERPLAWTEVAEMAARTSARLVRAKLAPPGAPRWFIAYHFDDSSPAGTGEDSGAPSSAAPSTDPRRFEELVPPADRYWADPFPVEDDGRYLLFYEEHLAGERDAHICVAELDPVRGLVSPRVVLRRDFHLSYPFVFRWDGAWYMIPETGLLGAVQLYRAERFPDAWTHVGDLLTGECFVDATVAEIDGRWWMFVGVLPPGTDEATALHVYHAVTPLGPWVPHAHNPVVVDVRASRPAGRVFRRGDVHYRPVQDGAPHYGHAMTVHRIDVLTPDAFAETPVERIEPTWRPGLLGTHTLNAAGRLTVLDARR